MSIIPRPSRCGLGQQQHGTKQNNTHVNSNKRGIHKFKVSPEHNMVDFKKELVFCAAGSCI